MSIVVRQLLYRHPDRELLFDHLSFSIETGGKAALIGNNGSGKSVLLQILAGILLPAGGEVVCSAPPYYIPQQTSLYDESTIAQALRIGGKIEALEAVSRGEVTPKHLSALEEDWDIAERANAALSAWGLEGFDLKRRMRELSGGEKTRVFLAGMDLYRPGVILLDEPTNHLDSGYREKLYGRLVSARATILAISHDRSLLNLFPVTYELNRKGITAYGGNYDFYAGQKEQAGRVLAGRRDEKEKELRTARKSLREALEKKQKHEERGKKNNLKKGIGKMAMDTLKSNSQKSASRLKNKHAAKVEKLEEELGRLRTCAGEDALLKTDFDTSGLHKGKILVRARNLQFVYGSGNEDGKRPVWKHPLTFEIRSGDRILVTGGNGTGKSTLLKLIAGRLSPSGGELERADFKYLYMDQEYSIIERGFSVLEQAEKFNERSLAEHEIKTILNRFLFSRETWNKPCAVLSGGEKMKLSLCCLMIAGNAPDIFILDEPANNLDIANMDILASAIREFRGTVLLVSHDRNLAGCTDMNMALDLDERNERMGENMR